MIEYLSYILFFGILIIFTVYIYMRLKYGFWFMQPVFHVYDFGYMIKAPGIINDYLPEKNKYTNFKNIETFAYANQCTDQIIKTAPTSAFICNPSSCSDVPGRPIELCWNDTLQTFYPRQRYIMNNTTDKWPDGYKGFVSAVTPDAPVLTLDSYTNTTATLSWNDLNSNCLPISSYNIYQNGKVIENVSYTTTTTIISNLLPASTYSFYVTSLSRTIESLPSNQVVVTTLSS